MPHTRSLYFISCSSTAHEFPARAHRRKSTNAAIHETFDSISTPKTNMLALAFWVLLWTHAHAVRHDKYAELKFGGLRPHIGHEQQRAPRTIQRTIPWREDGAEWKSYKPPGPGNIYKNTGFVTAEGTSLVLNGKPWQFSGTNAFYAGLEYIMSEDELRHMMQELEMAGTSVIRLFVSSLDGVPNSMMPEGQLDQMKPQEVLDLIKYLRTTRQVELVQ